MPDVSTFEGWVWGAIAILAACFVAGLVLYFRVNSHQGQGRMEVASTRQRLQRRVALVMIFAPLAVMVAAAAYALFAIPVL